MLERRVCQFFISLPDAPKYDIIRTENENLIDRFLPEILTIKEYSTRVQYVFDMCWIHFEYSFNVNISGMKLSITSRFSVQIISDRPIKNW